MADEIEEVITPQVHDLLNNIAKDIKSNPTEYREAGKWMDEYCSEACYFGRKRDELNDLHAQKEKSPSLPLEDRIRKIEEDIKARRLPAILVRFQQARDSLLSKYENQQFISEEDARRIILITWLLTDPDTEKADLNITDLEKWSWEPVDNSIKMSRGYAAYLWSQGGRVYSPWMKLTRICWAKLSTRQEDKAESSEVLDDKRILVKSFLSNLLRASIKHLPVCGSFLYDVIYGTLDSQKAEKEAMKQQKSLRSGAVFEKRNAVSIDKLSDDKSSKSISLKVAEITLIAAIITLIGATLASPLWELFINKWGGDSIKVNTPQDKIFLSLKEICRDIDSRPLLQKEQTAKNYVGIVIKREALALHYITIEDETFRIMTGFPHNEVSIKPFLGLWGVTFTVKKDDYPQLASAKQELPLYVSGKIADAGTLFIRLSDVSLSFE